MISLFLTSSTCDVTVVVTSAFETVVFFTQITIINHIAPINSTQTQVLQVLYLSHQSHCVHFVQATNSISLNTQVNRGISFGCLVNGCMR